MPRRDGDARALRGRGISPAAPSTGNALVWNGSAWAPGAGGGGGSPSIDVLQANSYIDGQAVYFDGALWQLAQADAAATLGLGILTDVIQSPDPAAGFTVVFSGPIAAPLAYPLEVGGVAAPGPLTAGQYYFVSTSVAGSLTLTEPSTPSQFSNPVLFALSTTEAVVLPFRPSAISGGDITFVSGASATWEATTSAADGEAVTYQTQVSTVGAATATIDSFTPPANSSVDVIVTFVARSTTGAEAFKQDAEAFFLVNGGTATEIDSNTTTTAKQTAGASGCAVAITTNGTTIEASVTGVGGMTMGWTANVTRFVRQK